MVGLSLFIAGLLVGLFVIAMVWMIMRQIWKIEEEEARERRRMMEQSPDGTITVDELLGMAYDAYTRARLSPDASTKEKLTRVADGYLKQAKEMRRGRNPSDRFSNT